MATDVHIEKAKKWLLKKIAGTIDDREEALLQEWIRRSPRNKALADRVLSEEFLTSAIATDSEAFYKTSWQKLYHRIGYRQSHALSRWIAAAVVIGFMAGVYFISRNWEVTIAPGTSKATFHDVVPAVTYPLTEGEGKVLNYSRYIRQLPEKNPVQLSPDLHRTIVVPQGGEYRILLEDSSLIHLGPGSSLSIPVDFSAVNRTVNLSGEAYLIVHEDSLHPFVIRTERVNVRVLGTKLNIEAYDEEKYTKVTLEEGKAELQSATETRSLPVGYTALIEEDKTIGMSKANMLECVAWHRNRLVFDNQPMENIMRKLARWYDVEVAFSNDRVRNLHITMDVGKYETFNELADALEKMDELQIRIKRNKVVLISERNLNQE